MLAPEVLRLSECPHANSDANLVAVNPALEKDLFEEADFAGSAKIF